MPDPFTLDISETSGIAKKKSRMQHDQSSSYISPSTSFLETSADIDFLSDQNHQSFSRELCINIIDLEGCQSKTPYHDTGYSSGNMISVARDVTYPECSRLAHPKGNNDMTPHVNFFPEEDHILREGSVLKQTTEDYAIDVMLHSRRNVSFDVDANLSEGSTGIMAVCNHFDYKTDAERLSSLSRGEDALEKAIFSNSPSMGGIPDESTLFSNLKGSTIQFDDIRTERKRFAPVDSIDEISISIPPKEKHAAFQPSPSITRKCKSVTESDELSCSNARDRVCVTKESDLENCSFAQLRKRGSTFQCMNSARSSGSPYSVSCAAHGKDGEFADPLASEENLVSYQSINSRDFSNGEEEVNVFSNNILTCGSNGDGCYTSTCTNSQIDYDTCFSPEAIMDKFLSSCTNSQIDYETCFSPEANMNNFLSYGHNLHEFSHKKNRSFCKINDDICLDSSNSYTTDNHATYTFHIRSPGYNKRGSSPRGKKYIRNCGQDHVSKVRPRRSHSAPPFYKGRNKFSFLYNCLTTKGGTEANLQSLLSAPTVPGLPFTPMVLFVFPMK